MGGTHLDVEEENNCSVVSWLRHCVFVPPAHPALFLPEKAITIRCHGDTATATETNTVALGLQQLYQVRGKI